MRKPIKRHKALQPLSREHHYGLLLCWKIRQGFKLNIEPERIKSYIDWFQLNYLKPHFEAEEKLIFPILGNDYDLVKRALTEHRRLEKLFNQESELEKTLKQIEKELDLHIKFEERVLFNKIQKEATSDQLEVIKEHHQDGNFSDDDWEDHFWISEKK
ncbi:hemerythrin domain-containing protein [Christiangramia crocea]|uniref:Hemerythrin domain-containing protein n=1 Tax=Christiangramia crocea TaxID=2904124 RepID=A0A9X2A8K1_9FLAO|nr:hemerythrin domain-containing protein [Gramella crocea]MCG9972572.1 hemerythrin domain-containing protein [Gramella crocea]